MNAEHSRLAAWLLREASDSDEPADVLASAERSFQMLCTRLSKVATPSGCQVLLNRAIHLAASDFPFLHGVRAGRVPGQCLERVQESGQGVALDHMKAGLVEVMAQLMGLIELFIGEALMARLVRQPGPDARLSVDEIDCPGQDARS